MHYFKSYIKVTMLFCFSIFLSGCKPSPQQWQGYNEGRFTYISVNYPGILQQLFVSKGTEVKQGQPLFVLEQQPESQELKQDESALESAEQAKQKAVSDLQLAKLTYKRNSALIGKGYVEQSSLDASVNNLVKAKALLAQTEEDLNSSRAKVSKARWALQQKAVSSPKDALVFDTYFRAGELVQMGKPVLSLLAKNDIKTIFFVPEVIVGKLKVGQDVLVHCDGCAAPIKEKITFISPQAEYTPPVIYSNEARSKLVFHVEAMPALVDAEKLHPGQPVNVTMN